MPGDLLDPTICARIAGHGQIKLSVSSVALLGFTPGLILLRTTKVEVAGLCFLPHRRQRRDPPLRIVYCIQSGYLGIGRPHQGVGRHAACDIVNSGLRGGGEGVLKRSSSSVFSSHLTRLCICITSSRPRFLFVFSFFPFPTSIFTSTKRLRLIRTLLLLSLLPEFT